MSLALVEYFTQRDALDRIARNPVPADSPARELVERARQKRETAEAAAAISMIEAHLLIRDALVLLERALGELGTGDSLKAKLLSVGLSPARCGEVIRALTETIKQPFPNLDTALRDVDVDAYRQLTEGATVLSIALNERLLSKRALSWRRMRRVTIAAVPILFVIVGVPLMLRPPAVKASAIFSGEFKPELAIDGDVGTEWILPPSTAGWIEVRVSPPRPIHRVRMTNGHNRQYNDYAIKGYRLEAYRGDKVVATASGEFKTVTPEPPYEVPLVAEKADRVRLNVLTWFAYGGALAEIAVE